MCWKELRAAGRHQRGARHLHQLGRRHQSVRRRARRRRSARRATRQATLRWAWERGERILFLPDQHLGRNTAYKMGVPLDQMVVLGSERDSGAASNRRKPRPRKMILWKGHCSVHTRFTVKQIENVRKQHPGIRVIVHPECTWEVVQAADDSGSTEYILKTVTAEPAGIRLGRRHGDSPGEPPRQRGGARAHGDHARPVRVPVLDDVPRVAESPAVDDGQACSKARSTTGSSSPPNRSTGPRLPSNRMLSIQ